MIEQFIKTMHLESKYGNLADATVTKYHSGINKFQQQFPDLEKLKFHQVQKWFVNMDCSPGYKNALLTIIEKWLTYQADNEIVDEKLAERFGKFKSKAYHFGCATVKPTIPFTRTQVEETFLLMRNNRSNQERKNQNILISGLMLNCGYRISEVLEIRSENIEFVEPEPRQIFYENNPENGRNYPAEEDAIIPFAKIKIKNKHFKWHLKKDAEKYRTHYLFEFKGINNENFFELLKKLAIKKSNGYIFTVVRKGLKYGTQQKPENYRNFLLRLLEKASFYEKDHGHTPHSFRKSFATWLDAMPQHIVAVFLGHRTSSPVTEQYQSSGRNVKDWWLFAQKELNKR